MENFQTPGTVPQKPQRPTFLTVLCVLTFLGSAYGLVSNISGYLNANVTSSFAKQEIDSARSEVDKELKESDEKAAEFADKVMSGASDMLNPEKLRKNALINLLANVLTLIGALLMFNLKKNGFWIYLAGTAAAVASPIIVYGAGNLASLGLSFFFGFFGVLFVVLYAIHLKYMR